MSVKLTAQENENEHTHSYYKEQLALENKLFEVNRVFCTSAARICTQQTKAAYRTPCPKQKRGGSGGQLELQNEGKTGLCLRRWGAAAEFDRNDALVPVGVSYVAVEGQKKKKKKRLTKKEERHMLRT